VVDGRQDGPAKTLYNRWKLWGDMGFFARMMDGLASEVAISKDGNDRRDLSQSTPHGFEPWVEKGARGRLIGRTKGGMNTKLHAVTDKNGRPISVLISAGETSDYTGAAALLNSLPPAQ
jgi:hypothetical protein